MGHLVPAKGAVKYRFGVVYTPDAELIAGADIDLVAISTSVYQDDPDSIPVPWHPQGNCMTRLKRPSAVALRFTDTIPSSQVQPTWGYVPPRVLAEILAGLKRIGKA